MPTLPIYRPGSPATLQATVQIDEDTIYRNELMGQHFIEVRTVVASPLSIRVGDYIEYNGERYTLNRESDLTRQSSTRLIYTIRFEGEVYELLNKVLRHLDAIGFDYYGTAEDFIDLIVDNMNVIDADWSTGTVSSSDPQNLRFDDLSCREALTQVADAFKMEFSIVNKTINLRDAEGSDTALSFSYGRGNGLYSLTQLSVEESRIITRVYGYGAAKNLNYDYRSGAKRLMFDDLKLENNIALYGEREGIYKDETIYPKRTGSATAVSNNHTTKVYKITDSTIDFDINDYLLEGVEAKIVFKNGELGGNEFVITHYDHATKTITYAFNQEENDYTIPNATFEAAVSDEYTLVDIYLPQSYIDAAEAALEAATQEYLDRVSVPRVTYDLTIDPLYVKQNEIVLEPGDRVTVVDAGLGINSLIRINVIEFPIVFPEKITCQIGNELTLATTTLTEIRTRQNKTNIQVVNRTSVELARQNTARMRTLQDLIFDPDGYFDPANIKPVSIETFMLAVGAKSQNFLLNGVEIEANFEADPDKLRMSAGVLSHLEIEIDGQGSDWVMDANTFTGLTTGSAYYLYARCSKSALTGTWIASTAQITVEQETGYYHFLLGILFAVDSGKRFFQITKGMTFINGETITTGKIQSQDGLSYLDLSNNTFKVGDATSSIDWGVTTPNTLTIKGVTSTNFLMADLAFITDLGVRFVQTSASGKRVEIDGDDNNIKIYDAGGNLIVVVDDDVYENGDMEDIPGVLVQNAAGTKRTYVTSEGVFSNGQSASDATRVLKASLEGSIDADPGASGTTAGVMGIIETGTTISGKAFGGYFTTAFLGALTLGVARITTSITLTNQTRICSYMCFNTTSINFTFPASPYDGMIVLIKRCGAAVVVKGNGKNIYGLGSEHSIGTVWHFFQYDGVEWHQGYFN
ncbi:phage tail protein [Roseivirga sp. UBA838]|uniref:phage tail protein n=1 Tax=Roseivirga sp. UBA838 TaxID=1947393 RepID=UPI002579D335|nr:phage tail protein [Roseivirga sp. UBA838]|tara:strand:+ start:4357 stop:7116 length:2760 start_codon:yes stop_codon:yes gene_type:complete